MLGLAQHGGEVIGLRLRSSRHRHFARRQVIYRPDAVRRRRWRVIACSFMADPIVSSSVRSGWPTHSPIVFKINDDTAEVSKANEGRYQRFAVPSPDLHHRHRSDEERSRKRLIPLRIFALRSSMRYRRGLIPAAVPRIPWRSMRFSGCYCAGKRPRGTPRWTSARLRPVE